MTRLIKKLRFLSSGILFTTLSSTLFAVGTDAGVQIENLATLNFQVGGVDQTPVESSEAGNAIPGTNGTPTVFVVDRLLDLTVTTVDAAPVEIAPGANTATTQTNSIALTYTVANTGNATQNIALKAINTNEPTLAGLTAASADDFDPVVNTFRYYRESGDAAGLDALDTAIVAVAPGGVGSIVPVLLDVAQDASITVYVVAQAPNSTVVSLDDVAAISLVAQLAEPTTDDSEAGNLGTAGALILTDDAAIGDTTAGIEDVFADAAAGEAGVDRLFDFVTGTANASTVDDIAGNGQASDTSAYIIVTAEITVSKTATTVCDNTSLATNPKAIPGAVVRYSITVVNAALSPDAAVLTRLDDIIPVNTALTPMLDYNGTPGATCAGFAPLGGDFRAACTDAAGAAASGRSDCTDATADAYTYYTQAAGNGVDSNGLAAGNTITVCYDDQDATGTGNNCTVGTVVLPGDAGGTPGELAADQAVIVEFDVIIQ